MDGENTKTTEAAQQKSVEERFSERKQLMLEFPEGGDQFLYSKREAEIIFKLFVLVVEKYPKIMYDCFDYYQYEKLDQVANAITMMTFSKCLTIPLLKFSINFEFQKFVENSNASQVHSLFRENSGASKLVKAYNNIVGHPYLLYLLQNFITQIVDLNKSFEIDPAKLPEGSETLIEKNLGFYREKITALIGHITSEASVSKMPAGIRQIAHIFYECSRKYLPEQNPLSYVGGFLILRFINPALTNPEVFGILPKGKTLSPKVKRSIVIISKIMQTISNGSSFGEGHMRPFNTLAAQCIPTVQSFFTNVVEGAGDSTRLLSDADRFLLRRQDIHFIHRHYSLVKDDIVSVIEDEDDKKTFVDLLRSVSSYENKESFASLLSPAEQKSLRDLLRARRKDANYLCWTTLKRKGKTLKVLLVIDANWIFFLEKGKIIFESHFFFLREVESPSPNSLKFVFTKEILECSCESADDVISSIRKAAMKFADFPQEKQIKFTVSPSSRLEDYPFSEVRLVEVYRSFCALYNVEVLSHLVWDLEHLCVPVDKTEDDSCSPRLSISHRRLNSSFALNSLSTEFPNGPSYDFDVNLFFSPEVDTNEVISMHFIPLFRSITYSNMFSSISISQIKMDKTEIEALSDVFHCNKYLRSISLDGTSVTDKNHLFLLIDSIKTNQNLSLESLSINDIPIDERTAYAIGEIIRISSSNKKLPQIHTLSLTGSLDPKAFTALCNVLTDIAKVIGFTKITRLNVARSKLNDVAVAKFRDVLQTNALPLRSLIMNDVAFSGGNKAGLFQAICKCKKLEHVNFSGILFKKGDETSFLAELFSSAPLKEIKLCSAISSPNALEDIFPSLSKEGGSLNVDLSGCTLDSLYLKENLHTLSGVNVLNLSDSSLGDDGLIALFEGLILNTCVTTLNIDYCFGKPSTKPREMLIKVLSRLLSQDCDCPLTSLSMKARVKNNQSLGKYITNLFLLLSGNTKLHKLDVSGHLFGSIGATAFSRMIRVNTTLTELMFDENALTPASFNVIADSLNFNTRLIKFPLPLLDLATMQGNTTVPITASKIESYILRNIQTHINSE